MTAPTPKIGSGTMSTVRLEDDEAADEDDCTSSP